MKASGQLEIVSVVAQLGQTDRCIFPDDSSCVSYDLDEDRNQILEGGERSWTRSNNFVEQTASVAESC